MTCPNETNHTPSPTGLVAWQAWAHEMVRTKHSQYTCRECGLWVMWEGSTPPIGADDDAAYGGCLSAPFGKGGRR